MKQNPLHQPTMLHMFLGALAALMATFTITSCSGSKTTDQTPQQDTLTIVTTDSLMLPSDIEEPAPADSLKPEAEATTADPNVQTEQAPAAEQKFVIVTGDNVRLRTAPEITDGNIVKDKAGKPIYPKKGERLQCSSEQGDFYCVSYNGQLVYISKKFTTPEKK